jgi:uncharacterized protein
MVVQFEWDDGKAQANLKKHKVGFEEAKTVFSDRSALLFSDEDHSATEVREIMVGHSLLNRV